MSEMRIRSTSALVATRAAPAVATQASPNSIDELVTAARQATNGGQISRALDGVTDPALRASLQRASVFCQQVKAKHPNGGIDEADKLLSGALDALSSGVPLQEVAADLGRRDSRGLGVATDLGSANGVDLKARWIEIHRLKLVLDFLNDVEFSPPRPPVVHRPNPMPKTIVDLAAYVDAKHPGADIRKWIFGEGMSNPAIVGKVRQSPTDPAKPLPVNLVFESTSPDVTEQNRRSIEAILAEANRLLAGLPIADQKLTVRLSPQAENQSYDPGSSTLDVALRMANGGEIETETESRAAILHEYGHYLFDAYCIQQDWRGYVEVRNLQVLLGQVTAAIDDNACEIEKATNELSKTTDPQKREAQEKALSGLRSRAAALSNEAKELVSISRELPTTEIVVPYSELFADLIAVLVTRDGTALVKALSGPENPIEDRDFTRSLDLAAWAKSHRAGLFSSVDPHILLDPTRSFLGERFLKTHLRDANFSAIASLVLDAIRSEVESRASDATLGDRLNPAAVNERIIKEIAGRMEQKATQTSANPLALQIRERRSRQEAPVSP